MEQWLIDAVIAGAKADVAECQRAFHKLCDMNWIQLDEGARFVRNPALDELVAESERLGLYEQTERPPKDKETSVFPSASAARAFANAVWGKLNTVDTAPGEGDWIATYSELCRAVEEAWPPPT